MNITTVGAFVSVAGEDPPRKRTRIRPEDHSPEWAGQINRARALIDPERPMRMSTTPNGKTRKSHYGARHKFTIGARAEAPTETHSMTPPRTRGECPVERPCPWASCRYHLLMEITAAGNLSMIHGTDDPGDIRESCALDVAERGGQTLEDVGQHLNLTRERVRQIEKGAMAKLANLFEE